MASTKNLHLSMTPEGTNKSFLDWRLEQDGTENSNMQKLDAAWGDMAARVDGALAAVGKPTVAETAADMTDQTRAYVYTGSETGYTYGNWYYYDAEEEEWVSGGVYQASAVETDETLRVEGMAADAKATGELVAINETPMAGTKISITTTTEDVTLATMDDVDELKTQLNEEYAKATYSPNRYNPANNASGVLSTNAVGTQQKASSSSTLCYQKVDVSNSEYVTFRKVRTYSLTDKNDIVLLANTYVDEDTTYTVNLVNYPTVKYLCVSVYNTDVSTCQIELSNTLGDYAPFAVNGLSINGDKVLDLPVVDLSNSVIDNTYNNIALSQKLETETAKREELDTGILALANVRNSNQQNTKTIPLIDTSKDQKIILHLHKKDGTDYQAMSTDVFLPNAVNDFSDVVVKDNYGNLLSYDVVYTGNIDVIPDFNLPVNPTGRIFENSLGEWITNVSGSGICKSSDNGKTWVQFTGAGETSCIVTLVTSDDVIFYSRGGVLYRLAPPYTTPSTVLDISDRSGAYFLSTNMIEYSENVLFCATYQTARMIEIYKSTDNGVTWNISYRDDSGKYQHVHSLTKDVNTAPTTIYAGCDGGGGVLKSADGGSTWTDLRDLHPDMPQSTDYGVIYASSTYRLLGGETAIVGGSSIIKTLNDSSFTTVLNCGSSCYMARELDNKIFVGALSSKSNKQSSIMMSEDNGDTWKSIFNTSYYSDGGSTSDGARYLDVLNGQIIVGMQDAGLNRPSMRILAGDNNYYAEIIVNVPKGVTSISVTNGYIYGKHSKLYNDCAIPLAKIIDLKLTENANLVKEFVTGKIYQGDYMYVDGGKHLSTIYPYMVDVNDRHMFSLPAESDGFYIKDVDFENLTGITITFWGNIIAGETLFLFRNSQLTETFKMVGNQLQVKGVGVDGNVNYPVVKDAINFFAITIDMANNIITTYRNGLKTNTISGNNTVAQWITSFKTYDSVKVLGTANVSTAKIQHFVVLNGVATDEEIFDSYYCGLSDNL